MNIPVLLTTKNSCFENYATESAFTVDIHLHSTRFTALLSEIIIYAEYEVSRTPGAQQ
jgi:hypothetical protein